MGIQPPFFHGQHSNRFEGNKTLSLANDNGVTTLGLLWIATTDLMQVRNNTTQVPSTDDTGSTKRKVLAIIASIFNPLGVLSPAVIAYRTFPQKFWQDKLQWDEPLHMHLQQEWNHLHQTIPTLSQIKVNKNVICSIVTNLQIHGFCDSSEQAYGSCLYNRSTDSNNNLFCELLCSTSKVAP